MSFLKRRFAFHCVIAVFLFGASAFAQDAPPLVFEPSGTAKAIYQIHQDASLFVEAEDMAFMRGIRACLCNLNPQLKACSQEEKEQREFSRQFINGLGAKVSEKKTCQSIGEKYFQGLQGSLTKARVALALSASEIKTDQHAMLILNPVSVETYSRQPTSPFHVVGEIEKLGSDELKQVAKKLTDFRDEYCADLKKPNLEDCYRAAVSANSDFNKQLERFRAKQKLAFSWAVDDSTLLAEITTEKIATEQILAGLDRALALAKTRAQRNLQNVRQGRSLIEGPVDLLNASWALPYTRAVIANSPDQEALESELDRLLQQGLMQKQVVGGMVLVGTLAAFTVCQLLPAGKALRVANWTLGSVARSLGTAGGCRVLMGAALGGYFVHQSLSRFDAGIRAYLSSLEASQSSERAAQFFSLRSQVYLALLTFPLAAI